MEHDAQQRWLQHVVRDADAVLSALIDELENAPPKDHGGLMTEIMMHFGEAFGRVVAAVGEPAPPALARVYGAALSGVSGFNGWKAARTPLTVPQDAMTLTVCWDAVVAEARALEA